MRRVISFLLCVVLLCSLCACKKESDYAPTVKACASLYVMSVPDENDTSISTIDVKANQKQAEDCIELMKSDTVIRETLYSYRKRDIIHLPDEGDLRAMLTIERVDETTLIRIQLICPEGEMTDEELLWLCEDYVRAVLNEALLVKGSAVSLTPVDYPHIAVEIENQQNGK